MAKFTSMRILAGISAVLFLLSSCKTKSINLVGAGNVVDPYKVSITKNSVYKKAAVVSAYPVASEVGVAILKKGGNAFDAMIATQLALAVVYPGAGNIGGGGFLMGRKMDGEIISIDYRETAPAKAYRDMYLDSAGNPLSELSESGHLSSGVPGTVAGLFATHKYAKLPFAELIQPAIDLAEKGFVLTSSEASGLNGTKAYFKKYSTRVSALIKEEMWAAGDTLFQPELAKTLKLIRDNGAKGFYEGETAQLIVEEMQRGNGIITLEDLKNYSAKSRPAIEFNYRNYHIISFPPPSSGGLLIAQMLKMIEPYPMQEYGFQTPRSVQLMIEAERRAYADRAEHMGDPDYYKVPVQQLMSDAYLKDRMKDYDTAHASPSNIIQAGFIKESEQTTHISIIDEEGNMAAVTTTLNNTYGSRTIVGGAGFILNDEMDDLSIAPGVPNMYGALGGEANSIVAGKRMLSSMTPTLVLKNNRPFMIVGTPGGTTIPTSVFQTIVNVIDFKMNADDAVNRPKFHHQWLPDEVMIESNFSPSTREALEKKGYTFYDRGEIGRVELITINDDGSIEAAADKRGDDSASGYAP